MSIVSIEFAINGNPCETIEKNGSHFQFDVNHVKDDSITSSSFTGRHDHGALPPLTSAGYSSRLLSALFEAKAACDDILTLRMVAAKDDAATEVEVEDEEGADVPKSKKLKS